MKKILVIETGKSIKNLLIKLNENENYKVINSKSINGYNHVELPDLVISDLNSIKYAKLKNLLNFGQSPAHPMIPFLLIGSSKEIENQERISARTYYLSTPLTPGKFKNIMNKIFSNTDGDSPW